jgi:hypothetical protein
MSAKAKSGKSGSGVPPLNKNTEQSRDGLCHRTLNHQPFLTTDPGGTKRLQKETGSQVQANPGDCHPNAMTAGIDADKSSAHTHQNCLAKGK